MISENVLTTQQVLRGRVLDCLRGLSMEQKSQESAKIRFHILDWLGQLFQAFPRPSVSSSLGVFAPREDEPQLTALYQALSQSWPSLQLVFPKVQPTQEIEFFSASEFVASKWGVLEPDTIAPNTQKREPEIILVPGVVFHPEGSRIGRGKGYYDKYLSKNPHVVSCGVCFQDQLVLESWVENPHDRRMNYIISPESIFVCSEQG